MVTGPHAPDPPLGSDPTAVGDWSNTGSRRHEGPGHPLFNSVRQAHRLALFVRPAPPGTRPVNPMKLLTAVGGANPAGRSWTTTRRRSGGGDDLGDEVQGSVGLVADEGDDEVGGDRGVVGAQVAFGHPVAVTTAGEAVGDQLEVGVEVVGVGELLGRCR